MSLRIIRLEKLKRLLNYFINPETLHDALRNKRIIRSLPSIITVCVLLGVIGFSFITMRQLEEERFTSDLESHSNHLSETLITHFSNHIEILHSIEGLYRSSSEVTRQEFSTFVERSLFRHPGIQALEWVPYVPDDERTNFEAAAKSEGYLQFQFTERIEQGEMIPALSREEYYPVYYVEPHEGNELALGFDLASSPARLEGLNQARDTGEAIATSRLRLVQETENQYGFLVYVPVYAKGSTPVTVKERQQNLRGFAIGVFRSGDTVNMVMGTGLYSKLIVSLYDESAPVNEQLFYSTLPDADYDDISSIFSTEEQGQSSKFEQITRFDMAGRQWALVINPTPEYLATSHTWYPWLVLLVGIILTLLTGYSMITGAKRSLQVEGLADELTINNQELIKEISTRKKTEEELRISKEKYTDIVEKSNDGIIVIQDGLLNFANNRAMAMTGYSSKEIIGSLFTNYLAPEDRQLVLDRYQRRLRGEYVPQSYEARLMKKDGSVITIDINASIIDYESKPATLAILRDITERKNSEEILKRRVDFERAIINVSSRFIYTPDIDRAINLSLADMGLLTEASRSYLFTISKDGAVMDNTHEWCADGVNPQIDNLKDLPCDMFPWWMKKLRDGETIYVENVAQMAEEAKAEREILESQDIKSVLVTPVFTGTILAGFIGFDNIAGSEAWSDGDIAILRLSSEIIGSALERQRAEEALRESEERFRLAFQSSPDAIAITTIKDGRYVEINDNYSRIMGYSREELIGYKTREIGIWTNDTERSRMFAILARDGRIRDEEFDFRMKSGETRTWLFSAEPIFFAGEECLIGVAIDITDRKRQERLQRGENYILNLLGRGTELNIILDAVIKLGEDYDSSIKGSVLLIDESREILFPAACPSLPESYVALLKEGVPVGPDAGSCGTAAYRKQRVIVPDIAKSPLFVSHPEAVELAAANGLVACWSQPVLSTEGVLLGTIAHYSTKNEKPGRDALEVLEWSSRIAAIAIERKQAEREMRIFSNAVSGAIDGIAITDMDGIITHANPSMESTYGYKEGELQGKPVLSLNAYPESAAEIMVSLLDKGFWEGEIQGLKKNKSIFPAELSLSTVYDENNKAIALMGASRDITRQKEIEKERRETEQKAYLSSRLASIGQMAAGIAHEINNPLTGVIGFAELLMERDDLPKDIKNDLKVIDDGALRVSDIVKGLLTFARQDEQEREMVDVNEIIRNTLSFRVYEMKTNNIDVKTRFSRELPETYASGGQLQQVFLNLIVNAEAAMKKANNGGYLFITSKLVQNNIFVSIKDNGAGISKENLEKIFEPFFTTKQPGEGTGLGLSLCHGIISEHGGRIWVESEEGKGATFFIQIPVIDKLPEVAFSKVNETEEVKRSISARILVIDDESIVRRYLDKVLSGEGYEVTLIDDAEDALEEIGRTNYDAILLDIKMPNVSGIELFRKISEKNSVIADKIIFITGDVMAPDTTDFLTRTRVSYISKPIDKVVLKEKIKDKLKAM